MVSVIVELWLKYSTYREEGIFKTCTIKMILLQEWFVGWNTRYCSHVASIVQMLKESEGFFESSEGQEMACFHYCLAIARERCRVLMLRIPRPVLPLTQTLSPFYPRNMMDSKLPNKASWACIWLRKPRISFGDGYLSREWPFSHHTPFVVHPHAVHVSFPCPRRLNMVFGGVSPPGMLFKNKSQEFTRHIFFTSDLWNLTFTF